MSTGGKVGLTFKAFFESLQKEKTDFRKAKINDATSTVVIDSDMSPKTLSQIHHLTKMIMSANDDPLWQPQVHDSESESSVQYILPGLRDSFKGFDRDQAAKANDHGYSDWASKNDQAAAAYDAKSADAASKSAAQQGRWDLDENIWDKENRRRNLSDRKANKNVSKKFYHNHDNGGDNWERLNYDRDQVDDVFGYKAGVKKDAANRAAASKYNQAYDAAARKADAAHAADAARAYNQNDWKKEANGWNAADAGWAEQGNAARKGLYNDNYKNDQAQNAYDQRHQEANAWDQGADRYGADQRAYGKNYGAVGNAYGARAAYPYMGAGAAFGYGHGPFNGNKGGYYGGYGA